MSGMDYARTGGPLRISSWTRVKDPSLLGAHVGERDIPTARCTKGDLGPEHETQPEIRRGPPVPQRPSLSCSRYSSRFTHSYTSTLGGRSLADQARENQFFKSYLSIPTVPEHQSCDDQPDRFYPGDPHQR
jgi:hypothetical protein